MTTDLAEQFDTQAGRSVVVTDVKNGSIAAIAGIRNGTVILQVNQQAVNSALEFKKAVENRKIQNRVLLLIND